MRKILIIGSGKSISFVVKYFLQKSNSENIFLTIADINIENAKKLLNDHPRAKAIKLDVNNDKLRENKIMESDIVTRG